MTDTNYFGTDGIRGQVGTLPITADFLLKLGWAVGKVFAAAGRVNVLIGKDTRVSGYLIESALQAGLSAAGCNIHLSGPMPTPAIAYLTRALRMQLGIVISASHNPYEDNGIKFFTEDGLKISKETEEQICHYLKMPIETVSSQHLGKAWRVRDAEGRYIEYCKSAIPHQTHFKNLKIILDCANGATYHIAPYVFSELGAEVTAINISPNGFNINMDGGSTHPSVLQQAVLSNNADVGIAFDGDGDRVIMVDHRGEILDGDDILYIIAKGMLKTNRFSGGVVGTVMSNLGVEQALNHLGLAFLRVSVGDQNIIHALLEKNWSLGGEPSGHIICRNVTTTGDGIIAALQVLEAVNATGQSLHALKQDIKKLPQLLTNIRLANSTLNLHDPVIEAAIKQAETELGKNGRILLRKSGTEPVVRLMIEGENEAQIEKISTVLKDTIESSITSS